MKKCSKCNSENSDYAKLCLKCGNDITYEEIIEDSKDEIYSHNLKKDEYVGSCADGSCEIDHEHDHDHDDEEQKLPASFEIIKLDSDAPTKRCERCGYEVPAFTHVCLRCGMEFEDVINNIKEQPPKFTPTITPYKQKATIENKEIPTSASGLSFTQALYQEGFINNADTALTESNEKATAYTNTNSILKCRVCGYENPFYFETCLECGNQLKADNQEFINKQHEKYLINTANEKKHKAISTILSLCVTGLGNAYLGLYKRFVVEFLFSIVVSAVLSFIITTLIGDIAHNLYLIWFIYMITITIMFIINLYFLYDTLNCTDANNNNQNMPLFLNRWKIE